MAKPINPSTIKKTKNFASFDGVAESGYEGYETVYGSLVVLSLIRGNHSVIQQRRNP